MFKRNKVIFLSLAGVAILGFIAYQIPAVQDRLDWRIFRMSAYINAMIHPVGPLPTAIVRTVHLTAIPNSTPLPSPVPTLPPSPTVTPTLPPLPSSVSLTPPKWEQEDINNCGPATLSMYLHMAGWTGNQFDISKVIKPQRYDRNVNPDELVYWVRNYAGWLNADFRVGGNLDLLKHLLAAGFPVMIEETFIFDAPQWPNDDLWAAHYVLLTGYDDSSQSFTVQDAFHGPNLSVTYDKLEKDWEPFNHLYLLVYLPSQASQLQSLLGSNWDPDSNRQNALADTQAATVADPNDAFAWFNYGSNLIYFEKYTEAAAAYDTARKLKLPQRMFRYQFGPFFADYYTSQYDDLLTITQYTLDQAYAQGIDGTGRFSEEAWLWRGYALFGKGDVTGATQAWNAALKVHTDYCAAEYAINTYIQPTYPATCSP